MPEIQNRNKQQMILLSVIILVGAVLRFYHYASMSLFNDELSALTRLRFNSFTDLINKGVMPDMHPAGIQVFLYFLTRLFGNSEAVIRFPFVVAGILSIPLVYHIGKKWFSDTAGLMAAASMAVLEYPVFFSQLARPYSMGMFTGLLMVHMLTCMVQSGSDNNKRMFWYYAGFILAGAAGMYIHYFSFLFAAIVGLSGFFLLQKKEFKRYLLSGIMMVLMALPHYNIYMHQLMVGGLGGSEGWLGPPEKDAFRKYLFYVFNDSNKVLFLLGGISVAAFVYFRKTLVLNVYHRICILYFMVPFLIAYYYSIFKNPVFQYSILIFSFPYFLLLLFSFFPSDFKFKYQSVLVSLILLLTVYQTVAEKKYYRTEHFGVFRELAERTIELNERYGDRNIISTINVYDPYFINYYFEKFKRPVKMAQYRCMEPEKLAELREIVNRSTTPYFLHAWSNIYEPPEAEAIILTRYPYRIAHDSHLHAGLSFYARQANDSAVSPKVIYSAFHDFETYRWPNDQNFMSQDHVYKGSYSSGLGSFEFGNTFQTQLKETGYKSGAVLSVSLWAYCDDTASGAQLVVSIQDLQNNAVFWQSGRFDSFITAPKTWQQVFFTCTPKGNFNEFNSLKIFPWNIQKKNIWIDDLEIKLVEP